MTKTKNRPMIVMPVMLARRALWLLSLLMLLLFSVIPTAANSVSMACISLFDVERMHGEITKTEQFDGSAYVTVDLDGGDVSRTRMASIEQDCHMASLDFIKNIPQPANGYLDDVTTSQNDIWISKMSQSGPMFFPLALMPLC